MKIKIHTPIGKKGEKQAAEFIRQKGYRIIELNFRKNYTEVDIIVANSEVTVFVLIRARILTSSERPFRDITKEHIGNVNRLARLYVAERPNLPQNTRIDAIGIVLDKDGYLEDIEHVEDINSK